MPDQDAATAAAIDAMGQWYWDSIPHDVLQAGIDAARPVIEIEARHNTLCWLQPDDPAHLIACDRIRGHKGRHSWDDGEAEARASERQRIRDAIDKHERECMCDGYALCSRLVDAITNGDDNAR